GSASACARMADAALATWAVTWPVLEPGPDTVASARWRTSAVVTTLVPEARAEDGPAGDATRAAGPGTGPFDGSAASSLAAAGAARCDAAPAATAGTVSCPAWGAMGAMREWRGGPGA